ARLRRRSPVPPWRGAPAPAAAAFAPEGAGPGRAARAAHDESGAAFRWLLARAVAARQVVPPQSGGMPTPDTGASSLPVLEQEGEFWRIAYAGTTVLLRHSRGLALLAHLVRCPGRE